MYSFWSGVYQCILLECADLAFFRDDFAAQFAASTLLWSTSGGLQHGAGELTPYCRLLLQETGGIVLNGMEKWAAGKLMGVLIHLLHRIRPRVAARVVQRTWRKSKLEAELESRKSARELLQRVGHGQVARLEVKGMHEAAARSEFPKTCIDERAVIAHLLPPTAAAGVSVYAALVLTSYILLSLI